MDVRQTLRRISILGCKSFPDKKEGRGKSRFEEEK